MTDQDKTREQLIAELEVLRTRLSKLEGKPHSDACSGSDYVSGERYRELFENMTEGFALGEPILDGSGIPCDFRLIEINNAFERQSGLTREILGRPMTNVLPFLERHWIDTYCGVALTGSPVRFESYNRDLGKYFHVYCYSPTKGRFAILFWDVTERKRAEEALRQSESRFRLLSETAGQLLASQNPQEIVNDLCQRVMEHLDCQAFFNFLVDEKVGKLHLNACAGIPEEEARRIEWLDFGVAVCGCAALERKRIIAEDIFHIPDIRTELVKSYGIQAYACHPLMIQDKLIGTLSFGTKTRSRFSPEDISLMKTVADQVATAMERIRLVEELKQSHDELEVRVRERTSELAEANQVLVRQREVLQTIVDNIPVMLCFYDPNGKVLLASRELERLLGWSVEDMRRSDFSIMAECYPDSEYRQMVWDYMMEAAPGWRDFTMRTRSGEVIESSWANVRLSDGSLIGIGIDITERKRAEEERGVYLQKLRESNQALQDFASIASHDMQEPLRKVSSFGNMLKKRYGDALGEGGRDYLDRMLGATERMQSLLKSLLEYSRVTSRAEPFKEVSLASTVREVLWDLEVRIESTGGEVQVEDLPTIHADPTQMRQLFQNLIGNALKFHKEGEPPVVKVRCCSNGADWFEITVEDNGIGFEEEYLDRIFAPFQRLHGRSSQYEGTGMGLAICKKIIERHGGSIRAESEPGKGSRFIITLPLRHDRLG